MFIKGLNTQNFAECIHRPQNKPLHYETDSILYCIWNSTAEISSKWSPHPSMIRYAEAGCSKWWLTFAQRTNKANLIFTLCNKYFSQLLFCAAAVQTVLQQITQLEAKKFLLLIGYIDFSQSVHWFSQRRGERWKFMSLVWDFFFPLSCVEFWEKCFVANLIYGLIGPVNSERIPSVALLSIPSFSLK